MLYLLIYGLINDACNAWNYVALNDRTISE
jgi:hypothetical protein